MRWVDPLVAAAEQRELPLRLQFLDETLVEPSSGGAQEVERADGGDRLDGGEGRPGGEHHPGAAAKGRVVDRSVRVGCPDPEVVHGDLDGAGADRPPEDRPRAVARDELGEDREHLDAQRRMPRRRRPGGESPSAVTERSPRERRRRPGRASGRRRSGPGQDATRRRRGGRSPDWPRPRSLCRAQRRRCRRPRRR